jgi:hypothetical protein
MREAARPFCAGPHKTGAEFTNSEQKLEFKEENEEREVDVGRQGVKENKRLRT